MERLGLEDDVAIESRLVSKTIESAQTRVEGFNFDIRKRVVEFDDVINKQRETIYAERDKVLRNEDLTETVREFLDAEVEAHGRHLRRRPVADRVEPRGPVDRAARDGPRRPGDLRGGARRGRHQPRDARRATCATSSTSSLEARAQEHGEEVWSQVERFVLLRTIDSLWVEHLTEIDDMRRGIGLRGYAQQDPLNEFRREAYRLYEELRDLIRRQVATTIFRVTVKREPATAPLPGARPAGAPSGGDGDHATDGEARRASVRLERRPPAPVPSAPRAPLAPGERLAPARRRGPAPAPPASAATAAHPRPPRGPDARGARGPRRRGRRQAGRAPASRPPAARIGRNDPCWCGSGQKYKKCHGA